MPKEQQDTEIVLGTGRMLAIFFAFVLVCAFFFAIGFSLGRKTASVSAVNSASVPPGVPTSPIRPSPAKSDAPQSAPPATEMSFYKAVGEKNADTALASQDPKPSSTPSTASASTPASTTDASPKPATDAASAIPPGAGYYVQVAAVTRQEDADSLVEALKKKQYPAFVANNPSTDKFYRVQVGPYADMKEAEAMRARLVSDGYTPIVKR